MKDPAVQPLRVLLIGCGYAARVHARVLRSMRGVVMSFASRTPARAAAYAREFGGVRAFDSYEDALSDQGADVVLIATPTASHAELALAALASGHHVIVEKPAFLTTGELACVRAASHAVSRQVFVAENYVYKPIARELRHAIGSGELGDVRFVSFNATRFQAVRGWRGDAAMSGGGALFEAGVHWVSLAARIGLELSDIRGIRVGEREGPDRSSLVLFGYTNGGAGSLAHSWELPAPFGGARLSKVQGTRGAITFESNGFASVTTGRRRRMRVYAIDPLGYRAMLTDYIEAVRLARPPWYTLDMAGRDLAWLEQAQEGLA